MKLTYLDDFDNEKLHFMNFELHDPAETSRWY